MDDLDPTSILEAGYSGSLPYDFSYVPTGGAAWNGDTSAGVATSGNPLDGFVSTAKNIGAAVLGFQSAVTQAKTAAYVGQAQADVTKLQAQAQVAQAQAALKPGLNVNTLMIWIAVAGLVFAAMQVVGKK